MPENHVIRLKSVCSKNYAVTARRRIAMIKTGSPGASHRTQESPMPENHIIRIKPVFPKIMA